MRCKITIFIAIANLFIEKSTKSSQFYQKTPIFASCNSNVANETRTFIDSKL